MRVVDLFATGGILIRPSWGTFDATVRAMVRHMVERGCLPEALAEHAIEAVCEREALASTAMVDIHVSIPHARLEGLGRGVAGLAVSPTGVYTAITGVPIRIVVLLLSDNRFVARHLDLLSKCSLLLQSTALRSNLERAASENEALEALRIQERIPV